VIELQHKPGLFEPPKDTTAIVIPCSAEVGANATMHQGFALQAAKKWPTLARNVGVLFLGVGKIAHSVTRPYITHDCPEGYIGMPQGGGLPGLPMAFHVIALPIRAWDAAPIEDDMLIRSIRSLTDLCAGKRDQIWWLTEGNIVMPQLNDTTSNPKRKWSHFKDLIEPWLKDDRYVVLENKGTPT